MQHELFENVIMESLYERAPLFFERMRVKSAWSGFYDYNEFDQNAVLGSLPQFPSLFFCTGFSGHGLQQAPAAGRYTAELIESGRPQTLDLGRFDVGRILENKPIIEENVV